MNTIETRRVGIAHHISTHCEHRLRWAVPTLRCALPLAVLAGMVLTSARGAEPVRTPLGSKSSVAQATAALEDKDFTVRWQATYLLGLAGAPAASAVPGLVKVLADVENQEYVRGGAAWALGRIGPAAAGAVGPLTTALDSKLESVRRHAAEALGRIGTAAVAAVPKLIERLRDEDPVVRIHAAEALWQIARHEKALPTLVAALHHDADAASYDAAMALGELGPDAQPALPDLVQALSHADADTARAAALALGRVGPAAITELKKVLAQSNPVRQCRAIEALEGIGPETAPLLIESLSDHDPAVRRSAARALGRFGPAAQAAAAPLMQTVNDPVEEVRQEAARALRRIGAAAEIKP